MTACPMPDCDQHASTQHRGAMESTDGPIEHVIVTCAAGHHFLLPTEKLDG